MHYTSEMNDAGETLVRRGTGDMARIGKITPVQCGQKEFHNVLWMLDGALESLGCFAALEAATARLIARDRRSTSARRAAIARRAV
jgi:hypothetical protein